MLRRHLFLGFSFGAIAIGLSPFVAGCDAILGIHDVQHDSTGGTGGGSTTTTGGGGTGGTGGTTTTGGGGTGGTGGTTSMGDFAFAATSPNTDLPISGQAFLGVQISPENGFSGDVAITIKLPPSDVTFEGVTLPSGQLTGAVKVGAKASATLGQMFDLTLVATSGSLSHETTVHGVVTGTPGTLVEGFGVAGIASWTLAMDAGNVYDVREVAQNKILTTGDHLPGLASFLKGSRVLPNGTMDATFGPNADGLVTAQFCGCSKPSEGRAVMRLLNGNVVMVGTGNKGSGFTDDIALLRLKDDGTPDNIGGDAGKALIDLGGVEKVYAAELTADEHVLTIGRTGATAFVARLDVLGNLDTSFGGGAGFVVPDTGTTNAVGQALLVDAQERVTFTAVASNGADGRIVVGRLVAAGGPDPQWNGGAPAVYEAAGDQYPVALGAQTDGKVVVAGFTMENGASSVIVLRFLTDGTLDASFGTNGMTIVAPSAGGDAPVDMAILPDDRIVVVGNNGGGPFLMRFLAGGTPDPTFGSNGVKGLFLGNMGAIESVTVGALGRIILGGYRENQPVKGFVAKVWN